MTMQLKIGIIGCRGIPNNYGGFEQFAQYLSEGLINKGHYVTVYNSHNHPWKQPVWKKVKIIHCYDAANLLGTAGQFIYDLNCIWDARKRNFDIILFLGYTSSSIWWRLFPKRTIIISNMDGLEWKRTKYLKPVRMFLQHAEKLAVNHSDHLIADSTEIQSYLQKMYGKEITYISYGADINHEENRIGLASLNITRQGYYIIIARPEPENNITMILEGFHQSTSIRKMIILGNTKKGFGKYLAHKFIKDERICFAGEIFDKMKLHLLRTNCCMYFHGHSVGGTNPSLLEAMADRALIASHNNEFNRAVLGNNAFYFSSQEEVKELIESPINQEEKSKMVEYNYARIIKYHSWQGIIDEYDAFFKACFNNSNK